MRMLQTKSIETVSSELKVGIFTIRKLIKEYEIEDIPDKNILIENLENMNRTDITKLYKVTMQTLNKWIRAYDLDDSVHQSARWSKTITMTSEDGNDVQKFRSIMDVYRTHKISATTVKKYAKNGGVYKGYRFVFN